MGKATGGSIVGAAEWTRYIPSTMNVRVEMLRIDALVQPALGVVT
jgi:hypothetical protein